MILQIKVENYPALEPPAVPKAEDEPLRRVTFCVDPAAIRNRASIEILCADFIQAIRTAIMGERPAPRRIITPEDLEN